MAHPAGAGTRCSGGWTQPTKTYTATGKYAYEPFAKSGGYAHANDCVPNRAN